jgi:hypothetical protein
MRCALTASCGGELRYAIDLVRLRYAIGLVKLRYAICLVKFRYAIGLFKLRDAIGLFKVCNRPLSPASWAYSRSYQASFGIL